MLRISPLCLAAALVAAALPLHAQMQELEPGDLSYEIRHGEKEPQLQGCLRAFFAELNAIGQWSIMATQKCRTLPIAKLRLMSRSTTVCTYRHCSGKASSPWFCDATRKIAVSLIRTVKRSVPGHRTGSNRPSKRERACEQTSCCRVYAYQRFSLDAIWDGSERKGQGQNWTGETLQFGIEGSLVETRRLWETD